MSGIDTRIVEMKMDNSQFQQGVAQTLSSMEKLNAGMKMEGATKGFANLASAAKGVSLDHIASGVDAISSKFSAMSVIAVTALATIANKAVNVGLSMAKSFTIAPLKDGLAEYELKLNSVQTILANTQAAGTNLKDVNATLAELNDYSDKTIYNFGEMARNIGTFTAAGVDLETATGSIKGIANLAALSGSNSQQASTAMYQLSQAISAGKVNLMDWNSVVNAGMGGSVFQRALAQTAVEMGTIDEGALKLTGSMKKVSINGQSFRESITSANGESWLTSDVLTKTLNQFTGDMTAAELAAEGFTEAQIESIMKQAATASDAATQVKTFTQLMGTLKESAGSGWAESWQLIVGDFEQAKKLWTSVNNVFGGYIKSSADARNKVLADWDALGGRTKLIEGISSAWSALEAIMKPIKDAFRNIFPPATGKQLLGITSAFATFTKSLTISKKTAFDLKRIFSGVFAVLDIGWMVIKELVGVLGGLFGEATKGSGSFLEFAGRIGEWLVALRNAIKQGDDLKQFFSGLKTVLSAPIVLLRTLAGWLGKIFTGMSDVDTTGLDALSDRLFSFGALGRLIGSAWTKTMAFIKSAAKIFGPIASTFVDFVQGIGTKIKEGMGDIDYSTLLDGINTGLFAGLLVLIRKFLKDGFSVNADIGGGLFGSIKDTFKGVTGSLEAMQMKLKADVLLKIAGALALLTVSVVALSLIDSAALTKSLAAMSVMFVQLMGSMAIFEQLSMGKSFTKMPVIATSLILLSTAILILTAAVANLARLSWEELAKGLVGVGGLLAALTLFTKFASVNKGSVGSGLGLILLATAIKILASAMGDFAKYSWMDIAKGLVSMAGALTVMSIALKLIPATAVFSAAGVLIVAASLGMIAEALGKFGGMSWDVIGKGLLTLAGALVLISGALALLPPSTLLSAAAIFVAASSLGMIANALAVMGSMSLEQMAKGLSTLAISLGIIATAMALMSGALPGAAALLVVAAAMSVLAPILVTFGAMSWEAIAKGLIGLAGALAIIGIAGLVLTPVVPLIALLGAAILLLGTGMLAAGAGLLLFSTGLAALSVVGAAGAAALTGLVAAMISLIPMAMTAIGNGIIAFAKVIAGNVSTFASAMTALITALLMAIQRTAPKVVQTLMALITLLVDALTKALPRFVAQGVAMIVSILSGIAKQMKALVAAAVKVVTAFIDGIADNIDDIIKSGMNLLIKFIEGVTKAVGENSDRLTTAGGDLATAIVQGMVNGIGKGISAVTTAATDLAKSALNAAKSFLGIKSPSKEFYKLGVYVNEGFVNGLTGNRTQINAAFSYLKDALSEMMKTATADIKEAQAKLAKLTSARVKDYAAIRATTSALAQARRELKASTAARTELDKNLRDETARLSKLSDEYERYTTKLEAANTVLADAKKTRDDFATSVSDQYDNLPTISGETTLQDFANDMRKQAADTRTFATAIQKLRDLGLNDVLYRELLTKGATALPFVNELLGTGKDGVTQINVLGAELTKSASTLGTSASKALYQAAVDSAQGLVDGLEANMDKIEIQMDKIADAMVAAIKRKLGIKSPSRVFMQIGKFSNEGLADGLKKYSGVVTTASGLVGQEAIDAMKKSISGLSTLMDANVDMNPTIAPILDLTKVKKDASQLGGILGAHPLAIAQAYRQAQALSSEYTAGREASLGEAIQATRSGDFTYIQNNTSPKALSSADIYRQTKNQLSVMKKGAPATV